jgi:hypothetical protein
MLSAIAAEQSHAEAIARFQHALGTLVTVVDGRATPAVKQVLAITRLPEPAARPSNTVMPR